MNVFFSRINGYLGWTREVVLVSAAVLTACGGGGGDGIDEPPPAAVFDVGGTLSGLGAGKTLVIGQAGGPSASLNANGAYSLKLPAGTAYDLRIQAQPEGQTCGIANGTGVVSGPVGNVLVTCSDSASAFKIGGILAGLGQGQSVVLVLNASGAMQETSVNANGRFEFAQPVTGAYSVAVRTQPAGLGCAVARADGTATADVTDVQVSCTAATYRLSGIATGLTGSVAVRNGEGESLTVQANGGFAFLQPLAHGATYNVQVISAAAGQTCSVANGSGTATGDVGNVQLSCAVVVTPPPPPPPPNVPSTPAGLTLSYGLVKTFNISWGTVTMPTGNTSTVTYRLLEDADGPGPLAPTQVAGGMTGNTATYVVAGLLHTRLNARYSVQACNSEGCSAASAPVTPNLTQAIGYFKGNGIEAGDLVGSAVAISADGNTLAIGAAGEDGDVGGINGARNNGAADSGAVYVYGRNAGVWFAQAFIKASNPGAGDRFGSALALSADGSTLAVGALGEASNATGVGGDQANNAMAGAGAVYVFQRNAGAWAQQAYVKASNTGANDSFGIAVSISSDGNTLAVGASGEDSNAMGVGGNQMDNTLSNAGAVYVFARNAGAWNQQAYIKASNPGAEDVFGDFVAISGDGGTLAVGARGERSNGTGINANQLDNSLSEAGAVYVFTRAAATWSQQAYVKPSSIGDDDFFGISVALSNDGHTLAVGAQGEASAATGVGGNQADNSMALAGAAYVFARNAGTWTQQAYIKASNTNAGDLFGNALALSGDGNTLAVGARTEDGAQAGLGANPANNAAADAGAAYVFKKVAGAWVHQGYIKASNTEAGDVFGACLALSGDGNTLAVCAPSEDSAAQSIGGDASGNGAINAGAVYLY